MLKIVRTEIQTTFVVFEEIQKGHEEGFDAIIIACFDDTGLAEARAQIDIPIIIIIVNN